MISIADEMNGIYVGVKELSVIPFDSGLWLFRKDYESELKKMVEQVCSVNDFNGAKTMRKIQ